MRMLLELQTQDASLSGVAVRLRSRHYVHPPVKKSVPVTAMLGLPILGSNGSSLLHSPSQGIL